MFSVKEDKQERILYDYPNMKFKNRQQNPLKAMDAKTAVAYGGMRGEKLGIDCQGDKVALLGDISALFGLSSS